jgi:multicomponent K+:H+ antiporter subunit G
MTALGLLLEILVSLLILTGAFFSLVGSFGLAKLPDLMTRLHAPTKTTTLGVGSILIASMLYFGLIEDRLSVHELLITLFLFLTAPLTALMIAKAHLHLDRDTTAHLPRAAGGGGWATLDDDQHPASSNARPEQEGG